jgi:uncharacterized membrane protein
MYPDAMRWFDRLFLSTIACNLLTLYLSLPGLETRISTGPEADLAAVDFRTVFDKLGGAFLVLMAIWFFVSRLRSRIAKWVLTVLAAGTTLSMIVNPGPLFAYGTTVAILSFFNFVLTAASAACLHLPESRAWFAAKRSALA